MKRYTMNYTGKDKIAAVLDDLLAYLHNTEFFEEKINLKSYTVKKALAVLKEREVA